jgi:hypothetical protein
MLTFVPSQKPVENERLARIGKSDQNALTLDLNIHVRLDKMRRVDRSIGDDAGTVPSLQTIRNNDGLDVTDEGIRPCLGGTEETKVVDGVQGQKSRHAGLVDNAADFRKRGSGRVGGTVGESGDDTILAHALSEDGGDKGGKEDSGEHTGRHGEDRVLKLMQG